MKPNRVAVYLTALAGLLTAVTPAVANMDTTSTAGVVGGGMMVVVAAVTWLLGWQKHEDREHYAAQQVKDRAYYDAKEEQERQRSSWGKHD